MRIVVVASSYPTERRRAGEPSYTGLAAELARRGHDVTVVAAAAAGASTKEDLDGVRVLRGLERVAEDEIDTGRVARSCRLLRAATKGSGPLAVVVADATDLPAALLGAPPAGSLWVDLGTDWPLTAFAASHPWWTHARSLGGLARLTAGTLGAAIDPPDFQRSRFLVWSRARWEELLGRGLPVQGAHVLCPGVDTRLFGYVGPQPAEGAFRLHYQGPMTRDGGLNAVFLALQRLPSHVRVRIAAESMESSYLAELAELGRAAGVMDRVDVMPAPGEAQRRELLREAHAFVHSRESVEEFPRHAFEAAAAGVPVIAARIAGADGAAAWPWAEGTVLEFPAGDPRELAARVRELLAGGGAACERARRARRLVEARFGVTYGADQLERRLVEG